MKKLALLLGTGFLMLNSCSNDDDKQNFVIPQAATPVLLKSEVVHFSDGANTSTTTNAYTYDGTKLVKVEDESTITTYTYTDDLITKIVTVDEGSSQPRTESFGYNADKQLVNYKIVDGNFNEYKRETLAYLTNGNITVTDYSGDEFAQNTVESTSTLYVENGQIVKVETVASGETTTEDYTYDGKNNYKKFITGMDKLQFYDGTVNPVSQNITKVKTTFFGGSSTSETTYTYNSDGYPITKHFDLGLSGFTVDTDYAY